MKKKISIVLIITLIFNIVMNVLGNIAYATTNNTKEEKKNPDSYWSTTNAPVFYGTTKITLKQGIIDKFDVLDSRFRIFASDFEDGDLTPSIIVSGEDTVKVNEAGEYEITYTVTDSHQNKTTIIVPVIVTEDADAKINVERTLYTIPSVWNMDLAEFSRNNYGDRQMLGVFLRENQSIKARVLSAESNISVAFLNNDSHQETATNIPTTGEWVTLENIKEGVSYDSVPLVKTTVLSKANTELNKTYKIELEYDGNIAPVDYYHYLDNEEEFRAKWNKSQNSFGVLESETLIMVVPYADVPYMTNYYGNGFTSLDKFFEYYQKVVEKMDEYVGLEFNPEKITDQNVRAKYLIKANRHGVGAAYYAGDHVGVNNESMRSFFEMNWGGLHELAHGYQGSLGKGEMQLGEVANNIIGHYIQIDKSIYFHQGNWLGNLADIEEDRNANRLAGKTFLEIDEPTRLYVIINLFNSLEGGTTYAKMFSWYREELNKGRTMTNQDAYVESIADIYQINIIPYMEAWGLEISDETKARVFEANYPLANILKDMVQEDSLKEIMQGEAIDRKYAVVDNEVLQKYDITGDITLNIEIDDISLVEGKVALLKHGNDIVKAIKIEGEQVALQSVPVGTYYLQMPVLTGYSYTHSYVRVQEGANNISNYEYIKTGNTDFNNYIKLQVLGYNYNTIAYQLTFKDNYTKAEIRYPNQSAMSGNEYVKIFNEEGHSVAEDVATGGYFDFGKGTHEINIEPGYTIEINYPNKYASKVVAYNTLTNNTMPEYGAIGEVTTYTVIEGGLLREDMTEKDADDLAYAQLKDHLIEIIEAYKAKVTEEELNNKTINFAEKADVISSFNQLRVEDQEQYKELINKIKQGGVPRITVIADSLEYEVGTQIDLYSLIKAVDNEDGNIKIDKNSTTITTSLKEEEAGKYEVTYKVKDSDNNVATKTIEITIIENAEEEPEVPTPPGGEEEPESPVIPPEEGEEEEKPPITPPGEGEEEEIPPITPPNGENEEEKPPVDDGDNGEEELPPEPPTEGEEEEEEDEDQSPEIPPEEGKPSPELPSEEEKDEEEGEQEQPTTPPEEELPPTEPEEPDSEEESKEPSKEEKPDGDAEEEKPAPPEGEVNEENVSTPENNNNSEGKPTTEDKEQTTTKPNKNESLNNTNNGNNEENTNSSDKNQNNVEEEGDKLETQIEEHIEHTQEDESMSYEVVSKNNIGIIITVLALIVISTISFFAIKNHR